MADRPPLDLLIKNVRFVRPGHHPVETRDLGIADGRFTRVEPAIDAALARAVFDARGFIHSYPQGFPHPQPTHILWITGYWTPTRGGDPVSSEAEKVHVDWGLRFD